MTKAIFAGSFDPPTLGHLDIINRSLDLCDEVIVAIAVNPNKKSLLTDVEKVQLLSSSIMMMGLNNVTVKLCPGLLVDFANEHKAEILIRGVRTTTDFEYEYNLAQINKRLDFTIQTVFLPANEQLSIVSSSMVKELAKYKRDVSGFVPLVVENWLKEKFKYE